MVDGILLILAALCAVYFVIIVIYGGIGTSLPLYGCFCGSLRISCLWKMVLQPSYV